MATGFPNPTAKCKPFYGRACQFIAQSGSGINRQSARKTHDILNAMVKAILPGCLAFLLALLGCGHNTIDTVAAHKLSDEFMSDLIAHRADAAFDKMEPEFTKMVKRSDFAPQLDKLFQYCGWPQNSELKDVQAGRKIYGDGHTNPIRKFVYAADTDQFAKGKCYFSVDIAPSVNGVRVTSFGPLKVTSGNPYP